MHKAIPSDALVTAEDVQQIKGDIFRGEFKRLVLELVIREPEIAILIAENNEKVLNTVESAALTDVQRDILGTTEPPRVHCESGGQASWLINPIMGVCP